MSMEQDLRDILEADQFAATRRDGKRLALAIAGDIIAYRGALMEAGIVDPLLATLVEQFSAHWLGGDSDDVSGVTIMLDGSGE